MKKLFVTGPSNRSLLPSAAVGSESTSTAIQSTKQQTHVVPRKNPLAGTLAGLFNHHLLIAAGSMAVFHVIPLQAQTWTIPPQNASWVSSSILTTVSGYQESGQPVRGNRSFTVSLWTAQTGGQQRYQETGDTFLLPYANTQGSAAYIYYGYFGNSTVNNSSSRGIADALNSTSTLWEEVKIGNTTYPRTQLTSFGKVAIGGNSTRSITFTNTGSSNVTITSIYPVDGYQVTNTLPITVRPGGNTTLSVRFQPTSAKVANSYITLKGNLSSNSLSSYKVVGAGYSEMVGVQAGELTAASVRNPSAAVKNIQVSKHELTWDEYSVVRSWGLSNGYEDWEDTFQVLSDLSLKVPCNKPVANLRWTDAIKFCNAKSEMEGLPPVYLNSDRTTYKTGNDFNPVQDRNNATGYRLPLSVEWEWAARGGRSSLGYLYSGSNNATEVAWFAENSNGVTHAIGLKTPNELGLFDMNGNVGEWSTNKYFASNDIKFKDAQGGAFITPLRGITSGYTLNRDLTANLLNIFNGLRLIEVPVGMRLCKGASWGEMIGVPDRNLTNTNIPAGSRTVKNFRLNSQETTFNDWQTVQKWGKNNGNGYTDLPEGNGTTLLHAVTGVSWYDAVKWCNAKSESEGLTPVYKVNGQPYKTGKPASPASIVRDVTSNGYRLPTEAEWELAATIGANGAQESFKYAGSNTINDVAWSVSNSASTLKAGSTKNPTGLGFYDMSGNAWEWVWNDNGSNLLRGGSFNSPVANCEVKYRDGFYALDSRLTNVGFRYARNF